MLSRRFVLAAALLLVFSALVTQAAASPVVKLTDRLGTSQNVDLSSLEQLKYPASYKRSSGTVIGPFNYEGPSLVSLLALMGGIKEGDAVQLVSSDGYRMNLTYEQVLGDVTVYDANSEPMIDLLEQDRPVMMLSYLSDNPAFSQGSVRAIYAGPKAPMTDGHTWVKDIIEVKVIPMIKEWVLELKGAVTARMDRSTFESLATCPLSPHPGSDMPVGDGRYAGVPLWALVSIVDNVEPENSHYTYDRKLAEAGYTVRVHGADGSYADISSKGLIYDQDVFVAFTKDGANLSDAEGPLMLTGPKVPVVIRHVVLIELLGLGK